MVRKSLSTLNTYAITLISPTTEYLSWNKVNQYCHLLNQYHQYKIKFKDARLSQKQIELDIIHCIYTINHYINLKQNSNLYFLDVTPHPYPSIPIKGNWSFSQLLLNVEFKSILLLFLLSELGWTESTSFKYLRTS